MKIGATDACKLVRLDRQKFNDAVSRGAYQNPPPTAAGSERQFDEWQMLELHWFARFLDLGLPPASAGALASIFAQERLQAQQRGEPYDIRKQVRAHLQNTLTGGGISHYPTEVQRLFLPEP